MCVLALGWLARQPLLLVDEPFDGLDLRQTRDVGTALCRLAHGGRTLFLSIHQIGDAARVAFLLPFVAMRVVAGDWSVPDFSKGTISPKFKTVGGDADRASGILFNVKPNGDWLTVRYNDTENNVAIFEFHNGICRPVKFSDRAKPFMLDRAAWHELKLTIEGDRLTTFLDGVDALDYTLGREPGPGRNGAAPHADLLPANNPVLRPPVSGRIGLWAKTDSSSYFKDYLVVGTGN